MVYTDDIISGAMNEGTPIISYRWFPAANLDYYVAQPQGLNVFAIGGLDRIHKYAWINNSRGGFQLGMDGYFITTSRDFADPNELYSDYFNEIQPIDTILVVRGGNVAMYAFYYRLKGLKKVPTSVLHNRGN
jgi:hypothetical protein